MGKNLSRAVFWLAAGDGGALLLVTLAGFATHGELESAGLRLLSTFVPLCAAWALIAPWLGLYDLEKSGQPAQLWRPLAAMLLAAPLAGILRGFWLNAVVLPIFVLILGASAALGLLIWRVIWIWLAVSVRNRQATRG